MDPSFPSNARWEVHQGCSGSYPKALLVLHFLKSGELGWSCGGYLYLRKFA